jgi:hypothetical protein
MPNEMQARLGDFVLDVSRNWNLESDRFKVWKNLDQVRAPLWKWLRDGDSLGRDYARLFGLVIDDAEAPRTVKRKDGQPTVEIHAVRPAIRRKASGMTSTDLVIEITQRRDGYFDLEKQKQMDLPGAPVRGAQDPKPDFYYRAGATIIIDPATNDVRRVIRTPGTVSDDAELDRVRRFLRGEDAGADNAFDGGLARSLRELDSRERSEPFALLHQMEEVR